MPAGSWVLQPVHDGNQPGAFTGDSVVPDPLPSLPLPLSPPRQSTALTSPTNVGRANQRVFHAAAAEIQLALQDVDIYWYVPESGPQTAVIIPTPIKDGPSRCQVGTTWGWCGWRGLI